MTNDELFAAITSHRHRFIDRLESLTEEQWNMPSLCAGWRVRDVVGHLVSILEIPTWTFIRKVILGGGFDKVANRISLEYGQREPKALLATYRTYADRRFAPPVVGPMAPMWDLLVHVRDVERPLGLTPDQDPAVLRAVLDHLVTGKARGFIKPAKAPLGLCFDARDLAWSAGNGPLVAGTGEAILMALAARRVAFDEIDGDGVATLTSRLQ